MKPILDHLNQNGEILYPYRNNLIPVKKKGAAQPENKFPLLPKTAL